MSKPDSSAEEIFKKISDGGEAGAPASGDEVPEDAGANETAVSQGPGDEANEANEDPAEEAGETAEQEAAEQAQGVPGDAGQSGAGPQGGQPAGPNAAQLQALQQEIQKRSAELDAREAALKDRESNKDKTDASADLFGYSEAGGDDDGEGELSPEAAEAELTEDFGPRIVKLIRAVCKGSNSADAKPGVDRSELEALLGRVAKLEPAVTGMGNYINRAHRSAMLAAHDDMDQITNAPEFAQWVSTLPGDKQAKVIEIIREGSWPETVQLLHEYKDSKKGGEGGEPDIDMDGINAAAGVRSQGAIRPAGGGGQGAGGMSAEEIFSHIAKAQGGKQ